MINPAAVEKTSKYKLGQDFTEVEFADYLETAVAQFSIDDPGLPEALARKAVTYYVLHQIALKSGDLETVKEQMGSDFRVEKGGLGISQWLVMYQDLTKTRQSNRRVVSSAGSSRSDTNMLDVVRAQARQNNPFTRY